MKQKKEFRFWIPAALCAIAVLTAVAVLAPKNIAGVSAANDDTVSESDAPDVSQSDQGGRRRNP